MALDLGELNLTPPDPKDGPGLLRYLHENFAKLQEKLYSFAAGVVATAAQISFAPSGGLQSTSVQSAIVELDTEKANRAGDNFTGPINITYAIPRISIINNQFGGSQGEAYLNVDGGLLFEVFSSGANATYAFTGKQDVLGNYTDADLWVITGGGNYGMLLNDFSHNGSGDPHPQYALDTDLAAHLNDTTAAHAASAISVADAGGRFATADVENVLKELAEGATHVNGAAVTPTGALQDFTIPAWATRIRILLKGLSVNANSRVILQVGSTVDGILTTGYASAANDSGGGGTSTVGFIMTPAGGATYIHRGMIELMRFGDTFTYICTGGVNQTGGYVPNCAGDVTLSAILTTVRITTEGGTALFDAGSIAVSYD